MPYAKRQVNHTLRFRSHLRASREPAKMVASVAVVTLNRHGILFPNDVPPSREDFRKGFPVVCVENALLRVAHFAVEPPECCRITTAEHPGHGSPRATVSGLDDPNSVFLNL